MPRRFATFLALIFTPVLLAQNGIGPNGQPVQGIVVTFSASSIPVGGTAQALARYQLADQSLNTIPLCIWSSATTGVATVGSNSGIVTGVSAGNSVITCTPRGSNPMNLTGFATINVQNPPVITNPSCSTPPCALPAQTQNASVGTSLSPAFTATGGVPPYTWTVSSGSLPTGLSLGNSGCLPTSSTGCNITGTPTGTGTSTFTIQVVDTASNTNTLQVSLTINTSSGAPAQYGARTDTCEIGGSSDPGNVQCTGGSTGATGSVMSYLGRLAILGFGSGAPTPLTTSIVDTAPAAGPTGTPSSSCSSNAQPDAGGDYLCASLSAAPYAIGYAITDPDFNSTLYRITDYSLTNNTAYPCGGSNGLSEAFSMGDDGNSRLWSASSDKLIITSAGSGTNAVVSWNTSTHKATVSALCGNNLPGQYAFSGANDHILYSLVGDQESSVVGTLTSGIPITWPNGEVIKQAGGATANVLAVGSSLMQIGKITSGIDNHTAWTGQTSGFVFTPTNSTAGLATQYAYVNFLYEGITCDGGSDPVQSNCPGSSTTTPSTWIIQWQPLFNFNDVRNQAGTAIGNPFFPNETAGVSNGLPYVSQTIGGKGYFGYNAVYTGALVPSYDDTSFTIVFGDNGQGGFPGGTCNNSPGGVCTGPVFVANFTVGSGVRMIDTMTAMVTGDYGPVGQLVEGQYNSIFGSHTGTCNVGDILTQGTTGATAQILNVPVFNIYVGYITGSPDANTSHHWTSAAGCSIAPNGIDTPKSFAFSDFDTIHEAENGANAAYASVTNVQQSTGSPSKEQGCVPTCGFVTLTFTTGIGAGLPGTYTPGQKITLTNLTGTAAYLNSPNPYSWFTAVPWTVTTGTTKSGTTATIIVADPSNTSFTNTETYNSATPQTLGPYSVGTNGVGVKASGLFTEYYWQIDTLTVNSCISGSCPGHQASAYLSKYTAKKYAAHNYANSSQPCGVSPATPCPTSQESSLFPQTIPGDQHGSALNSGTGDNSPVFLATTNVAGIAVTGVGSGSATSDAQAYAREIDAGENFVHNSNNAHCQYPGVSPICTGTHSCPNPVCSPSGTANGCSACMYRIAHTFNTATNWNFQAQNNIGPVSPDGKWFAFPSDMGGTLGCEDGTSGPCWSGYIAAGPAKATVSSTGGLAAVVTTNGSGAVTVKFQNSFCVAGTYLVFGANAIFCGPLGMPPEQVTFKGFTETWLNSGTLQVTSLGACSPTTPPVYCSFTGELISGPAPSGYTGALTEPSGATVTPVACTGTGTPKPCQRTDVFIVDIESAN